MWLPKIPLATAAFILLSTSDCTPAEIKTIKAIETADTVVLKSLPTVQCVLAQVANGQTKPELIGIRCGGVAATSVIAIMNAIEAAILNGNTGSSTAGAPL